MEMLWTVGDSLKGKIEMIECGGIGAMKDGFGEKQRSIYVFYNAAFALVEVFGP